MIGWPYCFGLMEEAVHHGWKHMQGKVVTSWWPGWTKSEKGRVPGSPSKTHPQ
jgi:hypothetical protein